MENLETRTPVEIDTEIAHIHERAFPLMVERAEAWRSVGRFRKAGWKVERYSYLMERIDRLTPQIDAILAETAPFDAEFERRGQWRRFYLCNSDGGHVHYRHCESLRPSTRIAWLPELSGGTEETMVAQFGPMACTKCFPSAPLMPGYADRAAEQAAALAAKHATRCAGSGQSVQVNYGARYSRCPVCGVATGVSAYGKLRPHKAVAA